MKILLTGADGQFGKAFLSIKPSKIENHSIELIDFGKKDFDITQENKVSFYLQKYKPDIILNAAAYTNVDQAEIENSLSYNINSLGPKYLANEITKYGGKLIQLSTDYVFNGISSDPYRINSPRSPISYYGRTKALGEEIIENLLFQNKNGIILRTSWLMGSYGNNFALKMLELHRNKKELRVISDQIGSPTTTTSLARCCWKLIEMEIKKQSIPEIIHWCNKGIASWYDVAVEIGEIAKELNLIKECAKVFPIKSQEYKTLALRPNYSVLDYSPSSKIIGLEPLHWKEALKEEFQKIIRQE